MPKKTNFQINIEYYAVYFTFLIFRFLPRTLVIFICERLGDIASRGLKKHRKIATQNLQIAFPEMGELERLKIIRGTFRTLARQICEISRVPKITRKNAHRIAISPMKNEHWEKYREAKRKKEGVILLLPHFGGWEIFALMFPIISGEQPSYVSRKLDNPYLEEIIKNFRGRFGSKPIYKEESLKKCLKTLREGGDVGILPDVNMAKDEGTFVPFFGKLACTTSGVSIIAKRSKALAMVVGTTWNKDKKKYIIDAEASFRFKSSGNLKQDLYDFTAKYTKEIENLIRKNPEQWLWIHRRWKTRPDGEEEIY